MSRLRHIKIALIERPDNIHRLALIAFHIIPIPILEFVLQQQISRPKAEGQMEINSKVHFATVIETAAARTIKAHTLTSRVNNFQTTGLSKCRQNIPYIWRNTRWLMELGLRCNISIRDIGMLDYYVLLGMHAYYINIQYQA